MKIDKTSFVPLYRQLIGIIYQRIHDRIYQLHAQLPSQKEIAQEFDISLIVVRQAWREMIHEKVIVSCRGSGTVVNKIPENINYHHSLLGLTHDAGSKIDHQLLSYSDTENDVVVNEIFSQKNDEGYIHLKRLRVMKNTPVSIENNFLNKKIVCNFNVQDYKKSASLYSYLTGYINIAIDYAEEIIKAIVADKDAAKILQVPVGFPLLLITRRTYCPEGMFEYTQYIIKSEYFGVIKYANPQN